MINILESLIKESLNKKNIMFEKITVTKKGNEFDITFKLNKEIFVVSVGGLRAHEQLDKLADLAVDHILILKERI